MLQYYILLVIIEVGILEFLRDARNFVEGEKLHGKEREFSPPSSLFVLTFLFVERF